MQHIALEILNLQILYVLCKERPLHQFVLKALDVKHRFFLHWKR